MSEGKRTITVQVHEADEVPSAGVAYAYMGTEQGGVMKQITVTLYKTIDSDDDREYLAVFGGEVLSMDSDEYEMALNVDRVVVGYLLVEEIVISALTVLKEGE